MKSSGAEVDFEAIDRDRVVNLVRDIEAAIDDHDPHAAEAERISTSAKPILRP